MQTDFNNLHLKTVSGKTMRLKTIYYTGSTFYPEYTPTIFSPAISVWVDIANDNWTQAYPKRLITNSDCPRTTNIPAGVIMWRTMALKLGWPDAQLSWDDILSLATAPNGWQSIDSTSTWGAFKFGHAHPKYAHSGRVSVFGQAHAYNRKMTSLTVSDLWNNATITSMTEVQKAIFHYGKLNTNVLDKMVAHGMSYLHGMTGFESDVVRYNLSAFSPYSLSPIPSSISPSLSIAGQRERRSFSST